MNLDSASSTNSGPPLKQRKGRGAIAAKQKCDEQRPKCDLCQRMKLDCRYREPPPIEKDQTLVEILDRLKSLEGKVDQIPIRAPIPTGFGPAQPSPASQPSFSATVDDPSLCLASSSPQKLVHKMLTWPAIQQLLLYFEQGSAFIVRMQRGTPNLPLDESLEERPFVGMITFPALTRDMMDRLATAYFDTFNFIYPFMDRQNFTSDTLTRVHTEGFNGDTDSVIALLVFALGELAIEGSRGNPIEVHQGRPSGVRGGTSSRPPGLALFNEARKRIGFVLTGQVLVTCSPIDSNSPRGDLIKRAYWHCAIMETDQYLELDLPGTGMIGLEDRVGVPSFNSPFCEADHRGNQSSHFEAYYASQVALRRLCANLHHSINDSMTNTDALVLSNEDLSGPIASSLNQLASQLTQWRGMLPRDLQWAEDDPASFLTPQPMALGRYNQPLDPNLSSNQGHSGLPLFTTDLDSEPVHYPYAYDIQVAWLRTSYYYAKYMVHRPFVYKALHFPEQMTQEDAEGVAECLCSCLKWPLTLSPTSHRKRLVPCLFRWSQNFLGILLILHMTRHNPMLRDIRAQLCGPRFEAEADQTVHLMLDWLRDLESSDPISMWCWKIVQGIYHLDL
ncbi:hypothetical protein BJ875DRAFT_513889 [Amylocarpus encephaloides]|uniref:Zn(2)-C6 fungal-type domain-containing protein n=1 Tax=Amylocarpus encephaloides TaxID=45428 RepID=A0A9P7YFS7_9HELO|nr:hypothetical protein BJ875DRAFT_513889 [Amylocarpus encephaloides]